jgi:putative tryptophan/tyrosine transport system substrate-binding protein
LNRRDAGRALLLGPFAYGVLAATSFAARAQPAGKVYRLGYLSQPSRESVEQVLQAFLRALRELGWVEGRNLHIEYRWADGNPERLPELAGELVRAKVDLIVAPAGTAALAAKNATRDIPIVMIFPSDPVELGLVASLSKPGGNVTGTAFTPGPEIFAKQFQILKEVAPHASRIAFLGNPEDSGWAVQARVVEATAQAMGVRLQHVEARGPEAFDAAFAAMARERAEALIVSGSSTLLVHRARLAELGIKARLPAMFSFREMVEAGGLMAYAVNMSDFIARAATYVDRVLKGAKPADLAIEQPTKFELIINLRTAKAIGLVIPPSLLVRADAVIQ